VNGDATVGATLLENMARVPTTIADALSGVT